MLGGALVGTYLLFAAASMRLALRAREVQVPDLDEPHRQRSDGHRARPRADVRRSTTAGGPIRRSPPAASLAQEPPAGSTARRQRSVRVWLSAGQRADDGAAARSAKPSATAQLRLSQDGLDAGAVSEIRSQRLPVRRRRRAGAAGQDAAARRSSLLVNRGERGASYVMPDLIGVNGDRAADILRDRGFRVAVVGSNPYPGVAAGIVLRQSPQAGFQIAPGEPISLEVSR